MLLDISRNWTQCDWDWDGTMRRHVVADWPFPFPSGYIGVLNFSYVAPADCELHIEELGAFVRASFRDSKEGHVRSWHVLWDYGQATEANVGRGT